jgi:hypothetical protein
MRDNSREVRRIEHTRESLLDGTGIVGRVSTPGVVRVAATTAHAFRHEPAMIPVSSSNKQS